MSERDSRASVTFGEAEAMRQRRAAGERGLDLAAEFGVSPQVVCDIVHGRRRARPDREHLEAEVERLNRDLDHEAREHQVTHERWMKAEAEVERLRAELTRVSDLVVDVMHGRKHSGELLNAISDHRSDITALPTGRADYERQLEWQRDAEDAGSNDV